MTIFFTSDTHFGHGGALGLFRRPFRSVAEMDEAMIAGWNAVVGPADEVWHLGDFAIGRSEAEIARILGGLAGRKHLVAGNNDSAATQTVGARRASRPMPSSSRAARCWSCAITPSAPGAAWPRAASTCTAIATAR